ncbi:SRPBCC family protein [uncultured Streptomyces sp.]|uniref:SRPBCC family protein n=1 Tax=uncultured Streptomyces sp. TaxID=174707 RepID=UPI002624A65C|nr:SRPBCC family protein [uncultured Streptomyces sp.]
MDWCHYRFTTVWDVPAPPEDVYAVLARPEEYPRWWPQVREVTPLDDVSGTARFRSVLPYDLFVTLRSVSSDPARRTIEAAMTGDLAGRARWSVRENGGGSRVVYEQRVEVRKPLMRRLAVPGRPLFRANHALMMRSGRRGLVALLKAGGGRPGGGAQRV